MTFASVHDAVMSVIEAIQCGAPLCRAELLDALTLRAVNSHSDTTLDARPTLLVEIGGSEAQIETQADIVREIDANNGGGAFEWATCQEERSRLWQPRYHACFASLQLRPGERAITTDACLPLSALAQCIGEAQLDLNAHGLVASVFGHVGDGNFHCFILIGPEDAEK